MKLIRLLDSEQRYEEALDHIKWLRRRRVGDELPALDGLEKKILKLREDQILNR